MLRAIEVKRLDALPFDQYLSLDAWSNSRISGYSREFQLTDKIKMGKAVDQFLTEPGLQPSTDLQKHAFNIAHFLQTKYIDLIERCDKQVSFMGHFVYEGFYLPFKTRPDFVFGELASIDLKVTHESLKNIDSLIKFMRYDRQCFIHNRLSGAEVSYLMFYSVKDKAAIMRHVDDYGNSENEIISFVLDHGKTSNL